MRSPSIDPVRKIIANFSYDRVIEVTTSKSRANRLIFLAAIDPREITIQNIPESSDVSDMLNALLEIGIKWTRNKNDITIMNSFPQCERDGENPITVNCGYGGTTTRFLSALLALGKRRYYLEAQGHMRMRPMKEIEEPLKKLGVEIKLNSDEAWLVIQGPVTHKLSNIEVESGRSTQFASALAMLVSLWKGSVTPLNMAASEDYFAMTIDCIQNMSEQIWKVPVDFSSASYPLAMAALTGSVQILNAKEIDSFQPDSILIDILKQMGASVKIDKNGLCVKHRGRLKPWSGDCAGFPDLVPTIAFLCAYADGESHLTNLKVLKHKESDRFNEVIKILKMFQVDITANDDGFFIRGKDSKISEEISYDAPDDHRMIMLAAMMMKLNNGGEIKNWLHINKSYARFFEDVIE